MEAESTAMRYTGKKVGPLLLDDYKFVYFKTRTLFRYSIEWVFEKIFHLNFLAVGKVVD